jgi:hypothetical protein
MRNAIRLAALALLAVQSAHAEIVTVDPANYATGTDISHAVDGVTLSSMSVPPEPSPGAYPPDGPQPPAEVGPIYSVTCTPCIPELEGQSMFGHEPTAGTNGPLDFWSANDAAKYLEAAVSGDPTNYLENGGWIVFRADFSDPTSFVQIVGGGGANGNFFQVDIWSSTNQHLGGCISAQTPTLLCHSTVDPAGNGYEDPWSMSFTRDTNDISYITAGGASGGQLVGSLSFDRKTASVPEPGTLCLFAAGLFGLAFRRKATRSH